MKVNDLYDLQGNTNILYTGILSEGGLLHACDTGVTSSVTNFLKSRMSQIAFFLLDLF